MTAPDRMIQQFKNTLHQRGHPHMKSLASAGEEFTTSIFTFPSPTMVKMAAVSMVHAILGIRA